MTNYILAALAMLVVILLAAGADPWPVILIYWMCVAAKWTYEALK